MGAVVWDVKGSDCGPAQEEPHPRSAVGENFRVEVWGSKHILLGGGRGGDAALVSGGRRPFFWISNLLRRWAGFRVVSPDFRTRASS